MASETVDRRAAHHRSLKVTALACLAGVFAGLLSTTVASGPSDTMGVVVAAVAVLVSLGAMRVLGVEISEFSTKDNLYVVFMTFTLWFVTWTILLTTGTTL